MVRWSTERTRASTALVPISSSSSQGGSEAACDKQAVDPDLRARYPSLWKLAVVSAERCSRHPVRTRDESGDHRQQPDG